MVIQMSKINIATSKLNKPLLFIGFILLYAFPALNNVHYDPQPQFWAEITVTWAAIALFIFVTIRFNKITIPFSVIPLALFAIYLIVQNYFVTHIDFIGLNYVTALEMLVCILLAISINTIRNNYGINFIVTTLCYALLIGALLQSLIGFIQYTGTAKYFGNMIFYDSAHPTTNIFGHFGQRNHYAHYLSWGVFGLIYLYQQRKFNSSVFYTILIWLCFSLTISASRSVFIYFALASIIAIIAALTKKESSFKQLMYLIIIASVTLFAIEYLFPILHKLFSNTHNFSSGLGRIDSENGTGRRGVEWQKAWLIFKSYPIFGIGWNGFAKQSVLLYPLFPNAALNSGLFTNCHNLILQLLAETGLIGTAIFILGTLICVIRSLRKSIRIEHIIILCMLGTTLSHSMNEYPLWYMYFLAGFITFISLDKPIMIWESKTIKMVAFLPLVYLSYLIIQGSIIFDSLVDYYDAPDEQKTFNQHAKYLEGIVNNNQLWSYFGLYTLDNYINVDTDTTDNYMNIKQQYYYTEKLATFHPYPDTMIKQAMLEFNLGNESAAESLVKLDVIAFPVYKESFRSTMSDPYYKKLYDLAK